MVGPRLGADAVVVADNASRAAGFLELLETDRHWLPTFFESEDVVIALRVA